MRTYGELRLVAGAWHLTAEAHVHTRFKRLFERVSKSSPNGVIEITDTPENCRELLWFMERYPFATDRLRYLKRRARQYDAQLDLVARILSGDQPPRPCTLAKPPYPGQLVAAELALTRRRLLVADDLGAGKTITALCMIAHEAARPALVVTLTDLPPQWNERVREFTPDLTTYILRRAVPFATDKRGAYGPQDLAAHIERGNPVPDIILTNYSKLSGWAEYLVSLGIKSVTFDEVQELRTGAGSGKYNGAQRLAEKAEYVVGLSATPIYNYGGEIYNVVTALVPDAFGSHEEFYREWTTTTGNGKTGIREPEAIGKYLREQGIMIRRSASEITGRRIDKPRSIIHKIDADLDTLDRMVADAAHLAKVIVSQSGHSNSEKFRAAGEFDYRLRHATGVAKAPYVAAFAKILLQAEDRIVLFGWHHDVYAILKETLSEYKPVFFTGSETPVQRQASKAAFCGGDARVLVVSLRAGAGMDGLQQHARVCLFTELDWSPRIHDQCVGRLARPGQERDVVAYYPICDHGSDPVIVDALGIKNQQSHGMLDPDAPLIEEIGSSGSNIRQLAEQYLAQMTVAAPRSDDGSREEPFQPRLIA